MVVGVGNVALDVARVLIKTVDQLDDTDMADEVLKSLSRKNITDVHVLGRRGPAYTAFTTKELRELGQLDDVDVIIDPEDRAGSLQSGSGNRTRSRPATWRCCRSGRPGPCGCLPADQLSLLEPTDKDHRQ